MNKTSFSNEGKRDGTHTARIRNERTYSPTDLMEIKGPSKNTIKTVC